MRFVLFFVALEVFGEDNYEKSWTEKQLGRRLNWDLGCLTDWFAPCHIFIGQININQDITDFNCISSAHVCSEIKRKLEFFRFMYMYMFCPDYRHVNFELRENWANNIKKRFDIFWVTFVMYLGGGNRMSLIWWQIAFYTFYNHKRKSLSVSYVKKAPW